MRLQQRGDTNFTIIIITIIVIIIKIKTNDEQIVNAYVYNSAINHSL